MAGERLVVREGAPDHPRPSLLVGRHGPRGRADHQVVEDHRELRKRVQQPRGQMRLGGARVEPDDVVLLGGVLPERVGREGAHVHRRRRIERAADLVQPEADDAAVLGQPVHVVFGWRGSGTRPIPLNRSG